MNITLIFFMVFFVIVVSVTLITCWVIYINSFKYFLIHVKGIETSKGRNGHQYYVRGSKRHRIQTMEKYHYTEYLEWKNKK